LDRVIIHGRAYDVTEFKEEHPGGKNIILRWAGKDATETYEPIHPPDTLDKYDSNYRLWSCGVVPSRRAN
jgi:cytochrome b involved in lipid metabolism